MKPTISLTLLIGLMAGCALPDFGKQEPDFPGNGPGGSAGTSGPGEITPGPGVVGSSATGQGGSSDSLGGQVTEGAFGVYDQPVFVAGTPPPPISGGTLALLTGHRAAVADPDRDQVLIVDLDAPSVTSVVALQKGDEPGRVVEGRAGQIQVVLRGAGALLTIDAATGLSLARRAICTHPRGLAYEAARDLVHVACAGGELVSLPSEGGAPTRKLTLDSDLRDVVVEGDHLWVSRFRAAELLVVEANGLVSHRLAPPPVSVSLDGSSGPPVGVPQDPPSMAAFVPAVAWRIMSAPAGGVLVAFQEEQTTEVKPEPGGYGSGCRGIVRSAVTKLRADGATWTAFNIAAVLPVDMAIDPEGNVVVISAAIENPPARLENPVSIFPPSTQVPVDMTPCFGGLLRSEAEGDGTAATPPLVPVRADGQLVAIAYDALGQRILQTREPSTLVIGDRAISLPGDSRRDTGHDIFHMATAGGLACASCHPEGREDGHVWTFAGLGARRTQSVAGGILGTEPFHWAGDMKDFKTLAHEVFGNRMSGPLLQDVHTEALSHWIDQVPALKPNQGLDANSVERGRALFQDVGVGCATCHAGSKLTNNTNADVGTLGKFQVPSLIGVAWRPPYLHSGCAPTLEARFGPCGGGELHGHTAALSDAGRGDLVAYLKSL